MLKRTILLVDDDQDDVEFFTVALKEIEPDSVCFVANDGNEALVMLRFGMQQLPDYIFLDLNMPLMNGRECLAELKKDERLKDIPVIICTTSSDQRDKDATEKLGAMYFFTKPLSLQKYCEEISFVIQNVALHHT